MNTKPPDTNLCFRQTKSFLIDLWKIPTRGDDTQLAIEAPGEAVEFASQVRNVTAGLAQNSSAMETDIKKGFDFCRRRAHHDQGLVCDLIHDVIADVGKCLRPV
jgi:hypothetical protein